MKNEIPRRIQPIRFPAGVLLSMMVVVFCILIDACRTEGTLRIHPMNHNQTDSSARN